MFQLEKYKITTKKLNNKWAAYMKMPRKYRKVSIKRMLVE